MKWCTVLLLIFTAVPSAFGAELTALGGGIWGSDFPDTSFSWQVEYRQPLVGPFAASLSWLNEGHLPDHHRDGQALQFWGQTDIDRRFSLAAAAGPYFYYDTTQDRVSGLIRDDHGWGTLVTLAGIWRTDGPWQFHLRSNWVATHGVDTYSALFGVGYSMDRPERGGAPGGGEGRCSMTTHRELAVMAGPMTVNNAGNPHSSGMVVEYRQGLLRYLDWTVSLLHEGDNRLTRRYGAATQLWLVRPCLANAVAIGFGVGPYLAIDTLRDRSLGGSDPFVAAIATLTGSYRLYRHWALRASWNRIITSYERDADLWVGGVAYRF